MELLQELVDCVDCFETFGCFVVSVASYIPSSAIGIELAAEAEVSHESILGPTQPPMRTFFLSVVVNENVTTVFIVACTCVLDENVIDVVRLNHCKVQLQSSFPIELC